MTGMRDLAERLRQRPFGERLLADEPMSHHTSYGIGGPADLLLVAREPQEVVEAARLAEEAGVPWRVIGAGTNILVADAGIRGLVIANECRAWSLDEEQGILRAGSGALLSDLALEVSSAGWAGLAWAAGIPGTVGGAVVNNAGAYGGSVADVLLEVTWLVEGVVDTVPAGELGYRYRDSMLKSGAACGTSCIVLEAAFRLLRGDPAELEAQVASTLAQRAVRVPPGCSAGSVFKRTDQYPAGLLIEQAGLKGRRIGDAEVSPMHANFFMNAGAARAADMRALIELVQREVRARFGQRLEPEIQFIGEWGPNGGAA